MNGLFLPMNGRKIRLTFFVGFYSFITASPKFVFGERCVNDDSPNKPESHGKMNDPVPNSQYCQKQSRIQDKACECVFNIKKQFSKIFVKQPRKQE